MDSTVEKELNAITMSAIDGNNTGLVRTIQKSGGLSTGGILDGGEAPTADAGAATVAEGLQNARVGIIKGIERNEKTEDVPLATMQGNNIEELSVESIFSDFLHLLNANEGIEIIPNVPKGIIQGSLAIGKALSVEDLFGDAVRSLKLYKATEVLKGTNGKVLLVEDIFGDAVRFLKLYGGAKTLPNISVEDILADAIPLFNVAENSEDEDADDFHPEEDEIMRLLQADMLPGFQVYDEGLEVPDIFAYAMELLDMNAIGFDDLLEHNVPIDQMPMFNDRLRCASVEDIFADGVRLLNLNGDGKPPVKKIKTPSENVEDIFADAVPIFDHNAAARIDQFPEIIRDAGRLIDGIFIDAGHEMRLDQGRGREIIEDALLILPFDNDQLNQLRPNFEELLSDAVPLLNLNDQLVAIGNLGGPINHKDFEQVMNIMQEALADVMQRAWQFLLNVLIDRDRQQQININVIDNGDEDPDVDMGENGDGMDNVDGGNLAPAG